MHLIEALFILALIVYVAFAVFNLVIGLGVLLLALPVGLVQWIIAKFKSN